VRETNKPLKKESNMKAIEIKTNKRGIKFALTTDGETYGVWKLSENYDGRVRGGIRKSWRWVEQGVTKEQAEKTFKRRTS
jgi:hypothetical protein